MVKIAVCFLLESQQPKPVPAHRPKLWKHFRFRVSKACGLRKKLVTQTTSLTSSIAGFEMPWRGRFSGDH